MAIYERYVYTIETIIFVWFFVQFGIYLSGSSRISVEKCMYEMFVWRKCANSSLVRWIVQPKMTFKASKNCQSFGKWKTFENETIWANNIFSNKVYWIYDKTNLDNHTHIQNGKKAKIKTIKIFCFCWFGQFGLSKCLFSCKMVHCIQKPNSLSQYWISQIKTTSLRCNCF